MPTLTERVLILEDKAATQVERSENSARQRVEIVATLVRLESKLDKLLRNGHTKPWVYGTTGVGGGAGVAGIILIIEKFLGG